MHATDFGRTLIIANPAAQSGAAREVAERLQRFLDMTARASQFDLVLTERMGHAKELAAHCMEDIDKDFIHRVKDGDIMVAGVNFGCGSSREHAPVAIKASGISCVIAANFARIFYRNAINIGLAILECPAASAEIENGDEVTVDFDTGVITDVTKGTTYQAEPFPPFIKDMIARGGLMASLKAKEAAK